VAPSDGAGRREAVHSSRWRSLDQAVGRTDSSLPDLEGGREPAAMTPADSSNARHWRVVIRFQPSFGGIGAQSAEWSRPAHVRLLSPESVSWFAPPRLTRAREPTLLWNQLHSPTG
jgi:hypothetical protein